MRFQKTINKVIGRQYGDIFLCDYVFEDGDYKGAVGSRFRPVGIDEYERMNDPTSDEVKDRFRGIWVEQAMHGDTEDSLEEFCQSVIDSDGADALWDLSYYDKHDLLREAYPEYADEEKFPLFECTGDACFSHGMEWDDIHDQEALDELLKYEDKESEADR